MPLMEWTAEMETRIGPVDADHRRLVDFINRLHDQLNSGDPDREVIGEILEGFLAYTYDHFVKEESMFKDHGYPGEAAHRAEHDRFTAEINALLQAHERGELPGEEALAFFRDWLVHHIMVEDKAYVPYFRERGLA